MKSRSTTGKTGGDGRGVANETCSCTVPCGCLAGEYGKERNAFAIKIPALLGILATHSLDKPVPGLKNLMAESYPRLQRGRMAWLLMQEISQGNREPHVLCRHSGNWKVTWATACCSPAMRRI